MTHRIRLLALCTATSLLIACGAHDNASETQRVADRGILEVEHFAATQQTSVLQWLPVQLDGDYGEAVRLVASDHAEWSDSGLPTLTYEVNFASTGRYSINIRGRRDSLYTTDGTTRLTFGADQGNIEQNISGFDDQWQWLSTDADGQDLEIEVTTAGVHFFSVASNATGIVLDQIEMKKIVPGTIPTPVEPPTSAEHNDQAVTPAVDTINHDTADSHNTLSTAEIQLNNAPSVSITGSTTTDTLQSLNLTASATDDGMPHGGLYYYWSKTAGPGETAFSNQQSASTRVSFSQAGTYTLQATANDGALYNNAYITVIVTATATPQTDHSEHQTTNRFNPTGNWKNLDTHGAITARHEAGGVEVNGKLYVMGGRGKRPVEVFDPINNTWRKIADAPLEMHHFQPVAINSKIYVIGAFTCCYPVEKVIDSIYIFDTRNNQWSKGPKLPSNRRRGGAGAAVFNGKIYLLGGNTKGHSGGAVNWFDEFDPRTGEWTQLANAPHTRDHVTVGISNGKFVAAGGRNTVHPMPYKNTVSHTNVYDFRTKKWSTAASIPTQRAGTMAVTQGDEVIIIGGESESTAGAHKNVEAFDVQTGKWRKLKSMSVGRHGGAAAMLHGALHVVSGSEKRAAGKETQSHEVLR